MIDAGWSRIRRKLGAPHKLHLIQKHPGQLDSVTRERSERLVARALASVRITA